MRLKLNLLFSLTLIFALTFSLFAIPDEGMYTPDQIAKLPLKKRGMKIKPIDVYNPAGVSLADAIMRVNIGSGGFGTGEFVSANGLILTNHHVGFDALVSASTPEKDYAKQGYKADSMTNELPAKGYSLLLTKRVDNVTGKILAGTEGLGAAEKAAAIMKNIEALETQEKAKSPNSIIRVQALNSGMFYYLYETQELKDVRVVYAPPQNIGFFGGDPDNFEWTRHTGDFTFLRAYTAPDGSFAEYSDKNIPFKPKKHLTTSLDGLSNNDFVFVLGYPGGTTRYRESQSINYSQNVNYPFLYQYLKGWSEALQKASDESEEKRLKNLDQIFSLNNSMKVYEGNVVAINRADFVNQRKTQETNFAAWVKGNPAREAKYGQVLSNLSRISDEFYGTAARDRIIRTFPGGTTTVFQQVYTAIQTVSAGKTLGDDDAGMQMRAAITEAYKELEPIVELNMMKFFFDSLAKLPAGQKFEAAENLFKGMNAKDRKSAEAKIAHSIAEGEDFDSAEDIFKLYSMSIDQLKAKHPKIVELVLGLSKARAEYNAANGKFGSEIDSLRLLYQQGMAEMKGVAPYPDANASLRFTFGNVQGYSPREAVSYTPFTTLKGTIDKDTGVFPFDVPQKLKDLQKSKDFGRYGAGDSVPVNFLATTDIIGGNSGSPILNGNGEQVGIVFDGNYEGLGNDIFFNPNYGRTIAVDIRYVLFVTEKFGGAKWVVDEMTISGSKAKAAKK